MPHRHLMKSCLAAMLLLTLALAGCGQTGPLYLPEKPAPEQPDPAQAH
jgi:predicted small lipoprotein YifL